MGYASNDSTKSKMDWLSQTSTATFFFFVVPPRQAMMNHKKLRRLKANTARYLLKLIEQICSHPFAAQELPRAPRQRRKVSRWRLPTLFSEAAVKNDLLPLGYQWCGNKDLAERLQHQAQTPPFDPDQQARCDRKGCGNPYSPIILFSCGHSFHAQCTAPILNRCFNCEAGILLEVQKKAQVARTSIFQPDANVGPDADSDSNDEEEDNDDNDLNEGQIQEMTAAEAAAAVQNLVGMVANLPLVHTL